MQHTIEVSLCLWCSWKQRILLVRFLVVSCDECLLWRILGIVVMCYHVLSRCALLVVMTSVLSCLPLWSVLGSFVYLLSGMVFTSTPGSNLTGIGLLPCLVIICSVVWNDVCPSDATSMGSLPSWLECVLNVMWLTWWNLGVGLFLYLLAQWGDLHVLEGLWLMLLWQDCLCLLKEWLFCLQLLGLLWQDLLVVLQWLLLCVLMYWRGCCCGWREGC